MRANGNASVLSLRYDVISSIHFCYFQPLLNHFFFVIHTTFLRYMGYRHSQIVMRQHCTNKNVDYDWSTDYLSLDVCFGNTFQWGTGAVIMSMFLWLPWQSNNHPWIYCCHTYWYMDRCGYQHGDIMTQTRFPFYRSFVVNLALWDLMKGIQKSVVKAITTCLGVTAASHRPGQEINSPESKD